MIDNNINDILELYSKCGLLGEKCIIDTVESLLLAKDLDIKITMGELYNKNSIELHFYTTKLNNDILETVDISHKTHPNIELIKALQMSMAYPILFEPIYYNNDYYIDGGILNNYPLTNCLEKNKNDEEILAFRSSIIKTDIKRLTHDTTLVDYITVLIRSIHKKLSKYKDDPHIDNTVYCRMNRCGINNWIEILSNIDKRKELIELGKESGENFYNKYIMKKKI